MSAAQQLIDKGKKERLKQGMQQGIEEGERHVRQNNRRIARRLLAKDHAMIDISEIMNLSVADIQILLDEED